MMCKTESRLKVFIMPSFKGMLSSSAPTFMEMCNFYKEVMI